MKEIISRLESKLFTPPVFNDPDQTLVARQIFSIVRAFILSVTFLQIIQIAIAPTLGLHLLLLLLATIAVSFILLEITRRGRVRWAAVLLVASLWLLITYFSWTASGLGARAAWGYFIVVFIAAMLLGRWVGLIVAVLCSAATLFNALLSPDRSGDPIRFWLINTLYLAVVLLLQNLASRSIKQSLSSAQAELRERRLAEAALRASDERFKQLSSLTSEGIMIQADGVILDANQAFAELVGYENTDDLIGKNGLKIVSFTAESQQRIRSHLDEYSTETYEIEIVRPDGSLLSAETHGREITYLGRQARLVTMRDISERKRAEKEKEQIISLQKATIESTADGILVIDHAGKITDFNQRFAQMWRLPDGILATRDDDQALDFVLGQLLDPQAFMAKVKALYDTPDQESFDVLHFKDGRCFERFSRPQLIAGRPVGRVWSFRDISVRKQAEKALQESEEKYRQTMNVAPIGIYIVQDLLFKFVNPEMARLHGYQAEEMIGMSPPDVLVAPEHRDMIRRILLSRQAGVRGTPYEIKALRKDGTTFQALVWGQGLVYEGKPASVGTLMDISDRKSTEEALKESEYRYRTLFEAASDAIFVMKAERFFDCNSKTLEMFGCRREQIIGLTPDRFSPPLQPDGRDSHEKALEKINAAYAGASQSFEWLHCKADGTQFMAEVSLNKFYLGADVHLLAIVRDIADRKALEEQLRQAQKMEAVGILAGGIAHDFNNILSSIVGYASLMQMQPVLDKKLKEYLDRILASTERAASLTHSLLAFSRKQAIDLQPVDINNAIFGFHQVLARMIGEDIDFKLNLASESLVVDADIRQIEQVLMNLATNSRDAMPHGGKLTITTRSAVLAAEQGNIPKGSYAVISLSDTGIGMDHEIQSHLFEPFFTTKEVGKGTGLGLAIVYGIVKNHQGFIKLESEAGRSTTFHIYLPLKTLTVRKGKRRKQMKIPRGTETILLVEDDAAVRHATRAMLEEFGYTVLEAADGLEALTVFEAHRDQVRLLLCDLIMPKKNGKETRSGIMKLKPDIKTLFMSGYTSDIIARKGILEPGMHLLLKPLHPTALLEKIRQVLDS
ncbi:MAG: PAS domain S-box protein [Candidatus Aminicenantes bacterium]|nr:PAS domain S-box protein [Candidatus Aminicenantes bacterium]